MYTLACKDFDLNCDFVAQDETIEGVIQKAKAHSKTDHPDAVEKMKQMGEAAADALIRSKIK